MLSARGVDRPVFAALALGASGLVVLATVVALGSWDEAVVTMSATTTPVATLIGVALLACGVSVWAQPASRVLAGVLGFGLALVAIPGANLGGLVLGSLLAVVGSAAALSWEPSGPREPVDPRGPAAEVGSADGDRIVTDRR